MKMCDGRTYRNNNQNIDVAAIRRHTLPPLIPPFKADISVNHSLILFLATTNDSSPVFFLRKIRRLANSWEK